MGRRAAHPEIADRRGVLRPTRDRPHEEQLVEGELPVKNIPLGQAEVALQIERRHHLPMQNALPDIGRVVGQRIDDRIADWFARLVPVA